MKPKELKFRQSQQYKKANPPMPVFRWNCSRCGGSNLKKLNVMVIDSNYRCQYWTPCPDHKPLKEDKVKYLLKVIK